MAIPVKSLCVVAFLVAFALYGANAAGECGKQTADQVAQSMQSCAPASQNADAAVSAECCALAAKMVDNPQCMCAVAYSDTIRNSGGKPENALSIPKRCGLANRPAGQKCGAVSIP
ncbi:uncharacterized protein [Euphorbia lathyris]|uniref:uncharacterized protein n=1 Tax=Euphorbia lathyris TaxID=212925 RepID=UPI003313C52F